MDVTKTLLSQTSEFCLRTKNGDYILKAVLGRGGFGITYLAERTVYEGAIPQQHQYTIKEFFMPDICHRNVDGSVRVDSDNEVNFQESRADFLVEANRLHSLRHEGIVPVNEVIETNNTVYYVMQYLGEVSLARYVKSKGRLSENEALRITVEIAKALDYLHDKNMNHLDVKPDNIMMVKTVDGLCPVLIDFGLSLHFKKNGFVTNKNAGLGTTDGYSPLEQYAGITRFSPSADVYALGATLLYMLTGKEPVNASNMSQRYIINSLPDNISERCCSLLILAMKKNADERMGNMAGFYSVDNTIVGTNSTKKKMTKKIHRKDSVAANAMIWAKRIGVGIVLLLILYLSYRIVRFMIIHPKMRTNVEQTMQDSAKKEKDTVVELTKMENTTTETKIEKNVENAETEKQQKITIDKQERPTSVPTPSKVEHSSSSRTLDLGYAIWVGVVKKGKPDGIGTLKFKCSHRIDAYDPDGNVAEAGDKINGTFSNGHLEYGTWIKATGEKVKLMIGQ